MSIKLSFPDQSAASLLGPSRSPVKVPLAQGGAPPEPFLEVMQLRVGGEKGVCSVTTCRGVREERLRGASLWASNRLIH